MKSVEFGPFFLFLFPLCIGFEIIFFRLKFGEILPKKTKKTHCLWVLINNTPLQSTQPVRELSEPSFVLYKIKIKLKILLNLNLWFEGVRKCLHWSSHYSLSHYFCVPMKFSMGFPTGSPSSRCVPRHVPNSSSIYAIISFCQKNLVM
jgi:hypothetical protein